MTDPRTIADLHQALASLPADQRLRALYLLPATLDAAARATVAELRDAGWTWAKIGDLLGVSRQTVHERWAPFAD